jgi:NTE family protein
VEQMAVLMRQIVHAVNFSYHNIFRYKTESPAFLRNWLMNAVCDVASLSSAIQTHRNNLKALRIMFGDKKYRDTKIPFSSVTFDLMAGETFVIKRGKLVDGILPSVTLPGVFPPVKRGRRLLVDGFVLANIPVRELRAQGADFIISVKLGSSEIEPYQNGLDLLNYVESLKHRHLERWEIADSDFHIRINFTHYNSARYDNYATAIQLGYDVTKRVVPRLIRKLEQHGR